jgi:hypothetical protein
MQRLRIGWDRQEEFGILLLERPKNGCWVWTRIRLDENALQIQLTDQLQKHRRLVVSCGGIAGLAARQAQSVA